MLFLKQQTSIAIKVNHRCQNCDYGSGSEFILHGQLFVRNVYVYGYVVQSKTK